MRLLYPSDPMDAKRPDETYVEEFECARSSGLDVSLFSFEDFERDRFNPKPSLASGEKVLYRGWMVTVARFESLVRAIGACGASPFTSVDEYRTCHHLPSWYPQLAEFTAETVVLDEGSDFASAMAGRNWSGYFVKDYVKSLSTASGSLVVRSEDISGVVSLISKYRGFVEGGVCVRRKEIYEASSERRYFVFRGRPLSPDQRVPELVNVCASRIDSPFFSVDVAKRDDGELRVVELGDGQVSDRKEWSATQFVQALSNCCAVPSDRECL